MNDMDVKQSMHGSVCLVMKSEHRLILKEMLPKEKKRDPAHNFPIPPLNGKIKGKQRTENQGELPSVG